MNINNDIDEDDEDNEEECNRLPLMSKNILISEYYPTYISCNEPSYKRLIQHVLYYSCLFLKEITNTLTVN